ncbi:MAG: hypothetical protein K2Q26_00940 [Bdellovibrionales bacterium]|nr:hypothetical protein [Bdellovibrionales bacterium]
MKVIAFLTLILLSLSVSAKSDETILEYSFGNAGQGSRFAVKADGTVEHVERVKDVDSVIPSGNIEKSDLIVLKDYIAKAMVASSESRTCLYRDNGAYGTFKVYREGESSVIRSMTSFGPKHCMATINQSDAAKALEFFVNLFVKTQLPAL